MEEEGEEALAEGVAECGEAVFSEVDQCWSLRVFRGGGIDDWR